MREIDVIRQTHAALRLDGLAGRKVIDLYTDPHPTLISDISLRPFQRFALALDGFTVHPDLVGRLDDGETTFAIEAKGKDDLLRGVAQAACYRFGFHLVFLAGVDSLPPDLILLAQQQHIGVLAASTIGVRVVTVPPTHLPLHRHAAAVQHQFATTEAIQTTFSLNLPTHYLSIARALLEIQPTTQATLEAYVRANYPVLPRTTKSFRAALRGAKKLGLARVRGDEVTPTMIGEAAASLLPPLSVLDSIHRTLTKRGERLTLNNANPNAGAVLRWLLAADPVCMLIVDTLTDLSGGPVSMWELARHSLERDKIRALTIFFNPEVIDAITDDQNNILWNKIQPYHFRGTTFMQYKSILKHAGVLVPHQLGGASALAYNPSADLWELEKR